MQKIRNIAIIAHVDHGKTTLVDKMLLAGKLFREGQAEPDQFMDNNYCPGFYDIYYLEWSEMQYHWHSGTHGFYCGSGADIQNAIWLLKQRIL